MLKSKERFYFAIRSITFKGKEGEVLRLESEMLFLPVFHPCKSPQRIGAEMFAAAIVKAPLSVSSLEVVKLKGEERLNNNYFH